MFCFIEDNLGYIILQSRIFFFHSCYWMEISNTSWQKKYLVTNQFIFTQFQLKLIQKWHIFKCSILTVTTLIKKKGFKLHRVLEILEAAIVVLKRILYRSILDERNFVILWRSTNISETKYYLSSLIKVLHQIKSVSFTRFSSVYVSINLFCYKSDNFYKILPEIHTACHIFSNITHPENFSST